MALREPAISIYDIVHIRAAIRALQRKAHAVPLADSMFRDGWKGHGTVWRPTEIEALMNLGKYRAGGEMLRVAIGQIDSAWFRYDPVAHNHQLVGRRCPDCDKRYPLTKEYWHINKDGAHGLHSICKRCRNGGRTAYYALRVGRPIRAYERRV